MKNKNQQTRGLRPTVSLLACLVGLAAGAQQPARPGAEAASNPSSPALSPGVVLKVGETQITKSDIESLVPMQPSGGRHGLSADARGRMAEQIVRMIVLSEQAANDHLDASPDLRFKLEMQRIRTLAQAELDKVRSEIQVTSDEIHQYYADHPVEFDTVQVREFLVRKRPSDEDAASSGLSAEQAQARAESIRKELASGDSADKIAEGFSGPDVLLIDRKPRTLRRDEMIPALQKAVFEAKDAAVPEAVDTPDAVIVVDVLSRQHNEEKQAAHEIETKIRQLKLDAHIEDMKKKVAVWMDDSYFKDDAGSRPVSTTQQPASDAKHEDRGIAKKKVPSSKSAE